MRVEEPLRVALRAGGEVQVEDVVGVGHYIGETVEMRLSILDEHLEVDLSFALRLPSDDDEAAESWKVVPDVAERIRVLTISEEACRDREVRSTE